MAKSKRNIQSKNSVKEGTLAKFNFNEFLPQKYHVLAVILVIFIVFLAFFYPLFFGNKTFESGDIISSRSMQNYVHQHKDGYTLWNPLIFCGMPAYAIGTGYKWFNLIYVGFTAVRSIFTSFFSVEYTMWAFYLIILAINSFFLMRYLTRNTLVSLFTGLTTAFSTGIVVFLLIGHVTKLTSIAMYPLIFLMILRLKEKLSLIDFLILVIALQLLVQGFHVQIIFYTLFSVGIFYLYFFLKAIFKKHIEERNKILKSAAALVIAVIIALLIQSDNITQVYQYSNYSTRGSKSIVEQNAKTSEPSSSEYYKYHTNWSFSPEEVLTFVVPSYVGFGNSIYKGPLTQNQPVNVNTYFGQMPFVDVAMYMGILVFFLGLYASITRWKDPFVQFLTILAALSLLISFGNTFPIVFDILFYYLPYFDKFRVPSMILVLVQLSFPVLAGLGLMKIISLKEDKDDKARKLLKYFTYAFSAFFLFGILFNGALTSWFTERVNDYAATLTATQPRYAQQFQALAGYAADMFTSDYLFGFAFLTIGFWAAIGYLNSKLSKDVFVVIIIFVAMFDLLRIDSRSAEPKYVEAQNVKGMFNQPNYVSTIKNQNDKNPFRILNMKQDGSLGSLNNNSNYNAYFMLEDFYGYSGIKPRNYQDIMDVVGPVNPTLWRMLNVKYIVSSQQVQMAGFQQIGQGEKEFTYKNNSALPRAYFVNNVEQKSAIDILNSIKNNSFDPKNTAFVNEKDFTVDKPDSTAYVNINTYKDETIGMEVNSSGNNFLFVGDTYIPTGWNAAIDGKSVKIYQANHDFMGIIVPKGKHTVTLKYAPASFYVTKYISLILSALVLLGLAGAIIKSKSRRV